MAAGTFKFKENSDGSSTLWYSDPPRLVKVRRYPSGYWEETDDEEQTAHLTADAEVFFRGFKQGRKRS